MRTQSALILLLVATSCGSGSAPDAGLGNAVNGQAIYANKGCSSCHGMSAEGTASGPNISGSGTAGIGNWSQADFTKAVRQAQSPSGKAYCSNMQPNPTLSDTQVADLFAFVKSKMSENKPTKACP
ncbi:MAG: cytochrome c [Archangiaceae bacterium]|nr:cytochrome c [Archangiaceae bacterium]